MHPGPPSRDIFAVVGHWGDFLGAQGLATATIESYGDYLLRAGRKARKDPRLFTEDDVVSVLGGYAASRGPAKGAMLRALKSFFAWAEDREIVVNPTRRLRVRKPKYGPAPTLLPDELALVLKGAETLDPRARPSLTLAYFTGARVGSLVAVMPEDVRQDRHGEWSIYFRVAKGDRPYELPIVAPEALEAVERLRSLLEWKPKMAVSRRPTLIGVGEATVWRWAHEAGELAGVKTWPHLFRHAFATDLGEADDRTWAEAMNHVDASLRRRYAPASEPRLRAEVGKLRLRA